MNVPLFFAECQDHYVTFYVNGSIGRGKEKLLYQLEVKILNASSYLEH